MQRLVPLFSATAQPAANLQEPSLFLSCQVRIRFLLLLFRKTSKERSMDIFREKLKASAAQAAQLAKNFEGLDAMAAKDDYIHTEEFNVARPNNHPPQQQQQQPEVLHQQQEVEDDDDDTSTISTHSSLVQERGGRRVISSKTTGATHSSAAAADTNPPQGFYHRSQSLQDQLVPLKVNVPDRQLSLPVRNDTTMKEDSSNSSFFEYSNNNENISSDDDDDDTSDDDDPIMSMIRKQKIEPKKKKGNNAQQQTKQKQHRFMEELDSRMAMENQQQLQPLVPAPASPLSSPQQQQPAAAVASWFSNAAAKSLQLVGAKPTQRPPESQTTAAPPLMARAKQQRRHATGNEDDMMEQHDVAVVSSTAVLGDEEMQELAQLRIKQQQHPYSSVRGLLCLLCHLPRQHPREAFIVFTLLLACYVYFRSRTAGD